MKIAHIVEPFSSGVVTSIIQLCSGIEDHEHIVVHGTRTSQDSIDAVKMRFPSNTAFFVWKHARREISLIKDLLAAISLFRILKRTAPDVVHLHSSKAGAIGRPIAKILGIRKVIYSPQGAPFVRKDISNTTRRIYIWIEKILSIIIGQIVCCCRSEHQAYQQHKIPSTYINNGIQISSDIPTRNINKEIITVGCAALATTQKNPKWFNEIAQSFNQRKDVEFLWIGDGELRDDLSSSNIKVTGWKDKKETAKLLPTIDLYLSTSGWEGLPFSVIEAMNNSSCLLLSDSVGHLDLVKNNINGFIFHNTEQAIRKLMFLLDNKEMVGNMGKQSRHICAAEFSAKSMCDQFSLLYNNVNNA